MADKDVIAELIIRLTAQVSDVKKGFDDAKSQMGSFSSSLTGSFKKIGEGVATLKANYVLFAAGIFAAYKAIQSAMDWMDLGAKAKMAEESFAAVTASMGIDGSKLIAKMKEVGYAFAEESDLMVKAQRLLVEGIQPDEIVRLMEASRIAARLMGVTVEEAFERVSEAVITLRTRGLKAAFPMDVAEVTDRYAASLHTTAKYLNEAGQRAAVMNEIFAQSEEKLRILGGVLLPNASENLQRINSTFKEMKELAGKGLLAIVGIFASLFKYVGTAALSAYAGILKLIEGYYLLQSLNPFSEEAASRAAVAADIYSRAAREVFDDQVKMFNEANKDISSSFAALTEGAKTSSVKTSGAIKAQGEKDKIDRKKLRDDQLKIDLDYAVKSAQAMADIRAASTDAEREVAITAMKKVSEDTTLLEKEYAIKAAQVALEERLKVMAAQETAEVDAAIKAGLSVENIRKTFDLERRKEAEKTAFAIETIETRFAREGAEAVRKAYQAAYGVTPEEMAWPGEKQTAEMDARSAELARGRRKRIADYNLELAQSQGVWRDIKQAEMECLDIELEQILETQNLKEGEEEVVKAVYARRRAELESQKEMNKTALMQKGLQEYNVRLNQEMVDQYKNLIPNAVDSAGDAFGNFFTDIIDGTKSSKDAFNDMWRSFLKGIVDSIKQTVVLILKMEVLKALGIGTGGKEGTGKSWLGTVLGSVVSGIFGGGGNKTGESTYSAGEMNQMTWLERGGPVIGSSGIDRVPIQATAGEFMHPVSAVRYYGEGIMEAMRRRLIPKEILSAFASGPAMRSGQFFAEGGMVTGKSSLTINVPVSVSDPRLASHLRTSIEETVVRTLKEFSR
jgi:hypothetical protein